MSSEDAVLWVAAAAVAVSLLVYLIVLARRAGARHARRLHYQRLGKETGPLRLATLASSPPQSMRPDLAAAIRRDAEAAARRRAGGAAGEPKNPHPAGSQEFVLWVATFHLTMTEIAEDGLGDEAAHWHYTKPPPDRKISPP